MLDIIFQAIKQSPRILWQSIFQPSKVYGFINESEKNKNVYILTFFFSGLLCGVTLAIPHYYLYNNLMQSIFFAGLLAGAGALAGTDLFIFISVFISVFIFVFADAIEFAVFVAVLLAIMGKASIIGALVFTLALAFAGLWLSSILPPFFLSILMLLPPICCFIIYLIGKVTNYLSEGKVILLFYTGVIFRIVFGEGVPLIKPYEMIIFSLSFFTGYFFVFQLYFIKKKSEFKNNLENRETKKEYLTYKKFLTFQKSVFIWCSLIAFLLYLLVYYDVLPESDKKITVISLCFVVMTIFILHISDYLICLPLWLMQLISASKKYENNEKLVYIYENSILFKNEMIYFQLPGLHKFISFFEKSMGIEEAVKRINDLYWFTFQEKQAQKAIIKLGKDKETAHQYVHFLLIENNMPLVKTLSKVNRLAELYLLLFDKQEETQQDLLTTIKKRFFSQKKREGFPEAFNDRINFVCREMIKEEGHRFNHEITKTLGAAHKFLNAEHLEDFYEASSILEKLNSFPVEIKYFKDIQNLLPQIKKIKDTLFKIESIERYETRRLFLTEQKQIVEVLSTVTAKNFYEPFATIWKTSLEHVAKLLEQQADIYKDSASLRINLKNKNIYPSTQEQNFHFEINNKGQEFAFDISVEIETDSPALKFCGKTKIEIQVIESGTIKKISLPIIIDTPINTIIKGNITFSDRDREGKKVPFSFPITIVEQSSAFHVIENPYIAGLPIRHSFLYFGREDAYNFIDKNISSGDHAIVCHGLRRTGKSSLLYRIVNQGFTDKKLVPIYFDMQAIDDEKDFYYSLSDSIVQGMSLQSTSDVENFSNFKRFIKDLKTELSEKTVVLLIDEFEELQMRAEHGKMSKTVFSNIRHLMQHEEKLIFIFCGTHKLEEMSADYWSIFFNTAIYYKVSYLSPKDTEKLIREPVKEQLTYDNLAVEQIQKMTHGQPYLTQLMCRTIVNDLNENKQRNYATIDDVDDAAEIIITHGHDHFSSHIWQESNTLERLILSTAAEELTHKQLDNVGFDAIYDKIGAVTKTFSRKECMDTLGRLVSKDILTEKNLRYSFPVNLFRKWVFARHPLRQVRLGMPY